MSKLEKKFLTVIVVLTISIIVLSITLIYHNPNEFVPNKDKYVRETKPIDFARRQIGDGLFCIDGNRYEPALVITYGQFNVSKYGVILECVIQSEFENEICYCYADDGYAVVYPESNLCKVFITTPTGVVTDEIFFARNEENDNRIDKLSPEDHPENKYIVYLDSFEEFTWYEQKMLEELEDE